MTIEPQDAVTVHIPAFPPRPPENRTPEETIAAIRASFPNAFNEAGLAIPAKFADMENRARWNRSPVSNMARPQVDAADHPNTKAAIKALLAKGDATRETILATMTAPMTCGDVATALKRSPQLIRRHLGLLAEQGRVTGRSMKGVTVWHRVEVAAE